MDYRPPKKQLAEDVILLNWRKAVVLADAYSTGSSLMPQKKNPDALELLRGKAGRVIGHAAGFMCTLKGLPRSYNKDLQEDKEALFDTLDTVHSCLKIAAGVMATMVPREEKLRAELVPEMLATDLRSRNAPYLRRCHQALGGPGHSCIRSYPGAIEGAARIVRRGCLDGTQRLRVLCGTQRFGRRDVSSVGARAGAISYRRPHTPLMIFTHVAYKHSINRWSYCESLLAM